jgi:cytochrome c peroxidase
MGTSLFSRRRRRQAALTALALAPLLAGFGWQRAKDDDWSSAERAVLSSLLIDRLSVLPPDPSNAVADHPAAAALGRALFFDTRLSRDGRVSCASCHDPARQFQDDRPVGRGLAEGARRTMPLADAARSPWLLWDGRKDSLWSQALGPLEDGAEHGSNRTRLVRQLMTHHRPAYEKVFGSFPPLGDLPDDASPAGSVGERRAWAQMSELQRDGVNRAFANLGKAIAAYERTLSYGPSRFDQYVRAVEAGDANGRKLLAADEVRGLRLFIGKGQCVTCHNGPLFTDQHFHNTGVPAHGLAMPDPGRAAAIASVQADAFNCLGRYSDAPASACAELQFIASDDPGMVGAFKTPSLRNVALRSPFMHAGQLTSLEAVVSHYQRSPAAAIGASELTQAGRQREGRQAVRLDDDEARQVVAFLRALSGPIREASATGSTP